MRVKKLPESEKQPYGFTFKGDEVDVVRTAYREYVCEREQIGFDPTSFELMHATWPINKPVMSLRPRSAASLIEKIQALADRTTEVTEEMLNEIDDIAHDRQANARLKSVAQRYNIGYQATRLAGLLQANVAEYEVDPYECCEYDLDSEFARLIQPKDEQPPNGW